MDEADVSMIENTDDQNVAIRRGLWVAASIIGLGTLTALFSIASSWLAA